MTTYIWCDEAGSTGNNLLDREQPLFAYAAVALDEAAAKRIVLDVTQHVAFRGVRADPIF